MDLRYCTGRTFPVKCRALKQDALVEREVVMRYSRLKPQGSSKLLRLAVPKPSMSKESMAALRLRLTTGTSRLTGKQVKPLFDKVRFPWPDDWQEAVQYDAALVVTLQHQEEHTQGPSSIIGYGIAVDDGHQAASLYDICICPSWQHQGLGSALVQHMVAALLRRGYTSITLAARPQHVMWYTLLGFLPDPDAVMVV